jgi:rhodanese-related sulfurtransferase
MTDSEHAAELPIETDVAAVAALLKNGGDFLLLDVREPSEYETAKISGSVLIPMGEILDRLDELQAHQDRLIVVHCHHGGRSLRVTQALRNHGFAKTQNMAGGIEQWSLEIDNAVPRY